MEQWVNLVKAPIDVILDFASLSPDPVIGAIGKTYGIADTAVQVVVAADQARQGQLKTSDALKLAADITIGYGGRLIALPGAEFALKALKYEVATIPLRLGSRCMKHINNREGKAMEIKDAARWSRLVLKGTVLLVAFPALAGDITYSYDDLNRLTRRRRWRRHRHRVQLRRGGQPHQPHRPGGSEPDPDTGQGRHG